MSVYSPEDVETRIIAEIARLRGISTAAIDPDLPFVESGLSSMEAVELTGELERWFGVSLPPTLAWDYPKISAAAAFISETAARSVRNE